MDVKYDGQPLSPMAEDRSDVQFSSGESLVVCGRVMRSSRRDLGMCEAEDGEVARNSAWWRAMRDGDGDETDRWDYM